MKSTGTFFPPSPAPKNTTLLLILGFAVTAVLFAFLVTMGLVYTSKTQARINTIVESHNVKTRLVTEMHDAARERSMTLHTMLNTPDPFDRDAQFLQFNGLGASFARARMQLVGMQLSDPERQILKRQGELTGLAVPLQNKIIDLIHTDDFESATEVLISKAVPAQDNVMLELIKLKKMQQNAARAAAQASKNELDQLLKQIIFIGGFALLLGIAVAVFIIRKTRAFESQLRLEKELAEVTLHSIGEAVITTDRHSTVQYLNSVAESLTRFSNRSARGLPLLKVMNIVIEETQLPAPDPVLGAIRESRVVSSDQNTVLNNRDGVSFAIEHTAAPIRDTDGSIRGGIVIFRDVTEVRKLAYQLSYQASHDSLTGLVNRYEFEIRLEQALAHARSERQVHAVLYLDLDQFKVINDTSGHAAGDELLKQVATILHSALRESDTLARLGGDEFGVLLEGCSIDKARQIAESLLTRVKEQRFSWDDKSFEIGVSIGMVPLSSSSGNVSDVLSAADTACYEAKDQGRNRVHVFQADDLKLQQRRGEMLWVQRINEAIEQDKFVLYCQKIVPVSPDSKEKPYYEILLRMQEKSELIPPMAFIPAAERYDLMTSIDCFVLEKTLATIVRAQDQKIGLRFSVNVSGQSLSNSSFLDFAANKIQQYAIQPGTITFEITETAAVTNFTRASQFIATLRHLGCHFALDDFGSGLSSFAYLKNIPVDYLKIDGSFVKDIVSDDADLAFVQSIKQIGDVMGITTIAEYVESEEILDKLNEIGIELAQGFFVGKPVPLNRVLEQNGVINDPMDSASSGLD